MSKAQILEELPRLTVSDRSQLFARLAELHEADLLDGGSPTPAERQALDEALADFERDPSPGEPWRDVFRQIRESRAGELARHHPAQSQGRPPPSARLV